MCLSYPTHTDVHYSDDASVNSKAYSDMPVTLSM